MRIEIALGKGNSVGASSLCSASITDSDADEDEDVNHVNWISLNSSFESHMIFGGHPLSSVVAFLSQSQSDILE